jgi:hypothetical protein
MKPHLVFATVAAFCSFAAEGSDPLDFWSSRWTKTNFVFSAIAEGNGTLVVGGSVPFQSAGGAFVSSDGVQWSQTLFDPVGILSFGNGTFIAEVGGNPWIHSSKDGKTWVSRIAPGEELPGGRSRVTFGLGRFWIQRDLNIPEVQHRYASPDGVNWELVTTNGIRGANIVFCGDRFISIGPEPFMSLDGIHFERAEGWPPAKSVAFKDGTWVVANWGTDGGDSALLSVSTDAKNWRTLVVTPANRGQQQVFTVGNRFVLTLGANYFFESPDGEVWTSHRAASQSGRLNLVAAGPNALVGAFNYTEAIIKPAGTAYFASILKTLPLETPLPAFLSVEMRPALTIETGTPGQGYLIETADSPHGPWREASVVFPTAFPFRFLAPAEDATTRYFRATPR